MRRHALGVMVAIAIVLGLALPCMAQEAIGAGPTEVRAAVHRNFPPQYLTGKDGQPTGFAIDVLEHVAARAGLHVRYIQLETWGEVHDALKHGRADLIPNMGITEKRRQWFAFTSPVETFAVSIFVRDDTDDIRGAADLPGHKVAAVKVNVGVVLLKGREGVETVVYDDVMKALLDLLAGQVDALVYPVPVLMKLALKAGLEDHIKVAGNPLKEIKRAISVRKDNTALLTRLDSAVRGFVGTDEYKDVYTKWYGRPEPYWTPRRIALVAASVLLALSAVMAGVYLRGIRRLNLALAKSEEKYRMMAENVTDVIWVRDMDLKLKYISPSVMRQRGFSVQEMMAQPMGESLSEEGYDKARKAFGTEIELEKTGRADPDRNITLELDVYKKDGSTFPAEMLVNFLRDAEGRPTGIIGLVRDITERKRAEEDLRQSESKYRTLLENIPQKIFYKDTDSVYVSCNEAFARDHGIEPADVAGKTDHDFFPWDLAEKYRDDDKKVLQGGVPHDIEETYIIDGRESFIETLKTPVRDESGRVIGILGVFWDITERKTMEEALRDSEKQYKTLFESGGEAIFIMKGLKFINCNARAVAMLRYKDPEEIIGKTPIDISPPTQPDGRKSRELVVQNLSDVLAGKPLNFPWKFLRTDGTEVDAEVTLNRVDVGGVALVQATVRDVTERKRLEEQLRQAQKMEAVGQLAGGVAHDFNNILMAIMGYGNMLQARLGDDEKLGGYVTHMLRAAERAADLTRSLLAFSRKQDMNLRPTNLNMTVVDAQKLLSRLIGEDIVFKMSLSGEELTVMADSRMLEQVLMNLATNARDAMPDGGQLTISTESALLDSHAAEASGLDRPGSYAVLTVSDTGAGMSAETAEKIFEPFFTTKEVGKGTGLGLAMVYGIVRQHSGQVEVQTSPGAGASFRIFLPTVSDAEALDARPEAAAPRGGTETVLLAEDAEDVRGLVSSALQEYGYSVIEAIDGDDALARFRDSSDRVDVLLLDVIMPGKDGKKVYEEIKGLRPDIKVLFMSGYTREMMDTKGILKEGLSFILKPVSPTELLGKIREVLDA